MINVFQPSLGAEEAAAAREVFESGWVGRGARTEAFEAAFARHLGVPRQHVHGVSSCTEGLFTAMDLLGIGAGDEVVLPTISFVGAANAVAARGAVPIFCDVDERTLNARASDVEAKLSPRTRAVVLLHYGGYPGDVADIVELARARSISVVEDAACAVASTLDGKACGTFGDIGTWSFDSMKILVSGGDGGMLYVRDPDLAGRVEAVTYLGLETRSGLAGSSARDRWWEFEISTFGRRSILNDLTSAIGLVQLEKLPAAIERRRVVHERYEEAFAASEWLATPPALPAGASSSYYFYWIQLDRRDDLARDLLGRGIYTTFRYYPLHLVSLYEANATLPNAERAARRTLCIPLHQGLTDAEVEHVIDGVLSFGDAPHA